MALIASTTMDALPNIGIMVDMVSATGTANDNWVEMSTYGYTTVYMAIALDSANATEPCTISGSTQVNLTAGETSGAVKILVIGV